MVKIILHCSDTTFGNAAEITKWHTFPKEKVIQDGKTYHGNGWTHIGYHFVILNGQLKPGVYNGMFDGHIETGRPIDDDPFIETNEVGAHVSGYNKNSVGVCLIGKSGDFTSSQLESACKLVHKIELQFREIRIHQHSDFAPETKPYCAGINMEKFRANYNLYKAYS